MRDTDTNGNKLEPGQLVESVDDGKQYRVVCMIGTIPRDSTDEADFVALFDHDLDRFVIVPSKIQI